MPMTCVKAGITCAAVLSLLLAVTIHAHSGPFDGRTFKGRSLVGGPNRGHGLTWPQHPKSLRNSTWTAWKAS